MRLIDADDTMNQLRAYADRKHDAGHNELANGILKAVSYIRNNTVRVDAVEVVRCKDCKHYEWNLFDGCHVCIRLSKYVKEDFFCSYGERRKDHAAD